MKKLLRSMVGVGVIAGMTGWVGVSAAGAQERPSGARGADHAVFVQTDNTPGNQVIAYNRSDDGTLTLADTYDTGGSGGVLNGSVVDHLASQGSLTYDPENALLYAVNAGSNTVSVFSVTGDALSLRQVISSGGREHRAIRVERHCSRVVPNALKDRARPLLFEIPNDE